CSKHITPRGQFVGFAGRSQTRRHTPKPEWVSMTRFGMLGTGTCILDTIRLCVPCQLSQFCNGSWAILRKENSRNATQLIWRGVCSMRRHWLMGCGLFAKPRLLVVMLLRL